jgi:hypothetical protein
MDLRTGRMNIHRLARLVAALSLASCDQATEPEVDGKTLCASQPTEEACDDAVPDEDNLFATCAWVEWNEVQVDLATGATTLAPAQPTCEYAGGSEAGCFIDKAELSCAASDEHWPIAKTTNDGVLVAFSDGFCDRVPPPAVVCQGDEDNLEPSECAALCAG